MKRPKVFLTASTIVFTCALFNAQLSYASNRTYKNLPSYRSLYRSPQELLAQSAPPSAVPTRAASSTPAVTRDSNGGVTVFLGVRNIREAAKAAGITIPTKPGPAATPHPPGTLLPAQTVQNVGVEVRPAPGTPPPWLPILFSTRSYKSTESPSGRFIPTTNSIANSTRAIVMTGSRFVN
jgi:hypothetical protein